MPSTAGLLKILFGLLLASFSLASANTLAEDRWQTIEPGGETGCALGGAYRFHVRRADPARLMIFFNGGGACWSARTCQEPGEGDLFMYRWSADPGSGNDPREFSGAFDLDHPDNPFRDWSQVFVPYCTGDIHLGTRVHEYAPEDGSPLSVRHLGLANAMAALGHVFETHPAPERVFVAGASAGALSSPVFAAVVARQWPEAEVIHLASGAGAYRIQDQASLWRLWGVPAGLAKLPGIVSMSADQLKLLDLYRIAAMAQPNIRFHLFDHAFDAVQLQFQTMLGNETGLLPGLRANREELAAVLPSLGSYIAGGQFHTLLRFDELYRLEVGGVRAVDWVAEIIRGGRPEDVDCGAAADCRGP